MNHLRVWVDRTFRFLCSLKLAVGVMLVLGAGMTVATVLESLYDTATGQFWVYRAGWFSFTLFLLGVNILAVALSRWPWKKRHLPFLLAHLGILMLLFGSWVTQKYGLDGSLRLEEGQASGTVEINEAKLWILEGADKRTYPVKWTPPHAKFSPIQIPELGLEIDQFLSFADSDVSFLPTDPKDPEGAPALKVELAGGPMRIRQEFQLWGGGPGWNQLQAGPAVLKLLSPTESLTQVAASGAPAVGSRTSNAGSPAPASTGSALAAKAPRAELRFQPTADRTRVKWWARSSAGEVRQGVIDAKTAQGTVIEPGWKGGVTITVLDYVSHARSQVGYRPARIQYGPQAPPSAIHLRVPGGGQGSEIWLGLGDRAILEHQGRNIGLAYLNRQERLPFGLRLEQFEMNFYPGSRDPKSYQSKVSVVRGQASSPAHIISMNEPLQEGGITFYQASYEPGEPRPTVSILSVNRDPGRELKYWGSLLIVLGSIWLFWNKTQQARAKQLRPRAEVST